MTYPRARPRNDHRVGRNFLFSWRCSCGRKLLKPCRCHRVGLAKMLRTLMATSPRRKHSFGVHNRRLKRVRRDLRRDPWIPKLTSVVVILALNEGGDVSHESWHAAWTSSWGMQADRKDIVDCWRIHRSSSPLQISSSLSHMPWFSWGKKAIRVSFTIYDSPALLLAGVLLTNMVVLKLFWYRCLPQRRSRYPFRTTSIWRLTRRLLLCSQIIRIRKYARLFRLLIVYRISPNRDA
jgi:hypothetical protein